LALSVWWRRARQHFSIDAPRMSVRSRLPWHWRAMVGAILVAVIAGMWWWGFDFGQFFGVAARQETEARIAALEAENAGLRTENTQLRNKTMQQEALLAITSGAQASLSKQTQELSAENAQIKDELVFLQKLVADSSRQAGLAIQGLTIERTRDDAWRYSVLIVRGGGPKEEFVGNITLQATLQPPAGGSPSPRPTIVNLPDEQPGSASAFTLKFKYYQRLEGTFPVPPGSMVRAVTVRAYEHGQANPRATRNLVLP
jgi:hypothetical protein